MEKLLDRPLYNITNLQNEAKPTISKLYFQVFCSSLLIITLSNIPKWKQEFIIKY